MAEFTEVAGLLNRAIGIASSAFAERGPFTGHKKLAMVDFGRLLRPGTAQGGAVANLRSDVQALAARFPMEGA